MEQRQQAGNLEAGAHGPLQNGQTVHWDSPGADYPGVQRSRSSQKCVAHAQPANPQHPRLLAPPTSHARVLECAGTECRRGCTEHPAATLRPTGSLPRRSAAIMSAVLFPRAYARTLAAWERLTARLIHNGSLLNCAASQTERLSAIDGWMTRPCWLPRTRAAGWAFAHVGARSIRLCDVYLSVAEKLRRLKSLC